MADFTYAGAPDWNYYFDIVGGTVTKRTATRFDYTSTSGLTVTLQGAGFAYDGAGVPTGGILTGMKVVKTGVLVGDFTSLTTALTDYALFAFGQSSGAATVPVQMGSLYAALRAGDDLITGNDLSKTQLGYAGNDTIHGNGGDDWMQGGAGTDRYYGGSGRNGVYFDNDAGVSQGVSINLDLTTGNILNDGYGNTETATEVQMVGGSDLDDLILGGLAANYLYGNGGDDTVDGGLGDDYVQGRAGVDDLDGGAGLDWLSFTDVTGAGVVVDLALGVVAQDGYGTTDTVTGFEYVTASRLADQITGDKRDNVLQGNDGNDSLFGGKGNDAVYGGTGDDSLIGGDGFDFAEGGKGRDTLNGGAATDYLLFLTIDSTGHGVTVDLSRSTGQILDDGYGNRETARSFDNVEASNFADSLTGSGGRNNLWGFAGNDTVQGGAGVDLVDGDAGDDLLFGGTDFDTLSGGAGQDTLTGGSDSFDFFFFDEATPDLGGIDHITDYQTGLDKIVINTAWAADLTVGAITARQFLSGAGLTEAATAKQRLIYDTSTGHLYFDSDGTGATPARLFAILDTMAALTHGQIEAISTVTDPI
jgi:serralysin